MFKFAQPALLLALGPTVSFAALVPTSSGSLLPLTEESKEEADSTKKDSLDYPKFKDLPLKPEREESVGVDRQTALQACDPAGDPFAAFWRRGR